MATELPIACTLTAAGLRERLAEMSALGDEALLSSETQTGRALLRFEPSARERVDAIVAAESQCCAFLGFALTDTPAALELAITAPPGAEPVLEEIVFAFSERRRA